MKIKDNFGNPIDLSLGIAFNDDRVPGTFFKKYINHPKMQQIIENIKSGYLCGFYFFKENKDSKICSCKFCGSDRFYVKQGAWFAVLVCPECRYEIQWES